MWRGGCRSNISVAAPFVWRCLTGSAMAPFPHPAHRTGQADLPHLSDKTSRLHPRRAATKLGQAYEPEALVKVREWISSALASPEFVLEPQPPAQPHSCVVVEHPIRFAGCSNPRSARFNCSTSLVVSCQVAARTVSAWTLSTMRLRLFFDGR